MTHNALLDMSDQRKRWVIVAVMCVAILEVLDSTIINVALPHMMPALGANQEQITWVLTSYVVASAIMLPLTGFFSKILGEKRLLLVCTTGFMIASFLCGTASSLVEMVALRCFQGSFGAALIPLSQSILRQSFPPEKQGKAMAIWGLGIMVAPVMGPTLGGIITEYSSWRWVFYINTPFCIAAVLLALAVIPKTPRSPQSMDWLGILLMFIGIGCMQLFLDQGNSKDWLQSNFIITLMVTSAVALVLFVMRSLNTSKPAVNLRLFKQRNFCLATMCLAIFCATQFSLLILEPIMLQTIFQYTAMYSGFTVMPMGLFSALSLALSSTLINRMPVKYILMIGVVFSFSGAHYLSTFTLDAPQLHFLISNAIMGFGMGFFMVPLSVYALASLPDRDVTEGAGLYSYGRMLGTSVGISLMTTLVTRETQINWASIGANLTSYSQNLRLWLLHQHSTIHNTKTLTVLQQQLQQQASVRAFIDAFHLASFLFLTMIPLMLLMTHVKPKRNSSAH